MSGRSVRYDERGESETRYLVARGLYAAAAASWRAGKLEWASLVDAFSRLARQTARCVREAATDEDARAFYERHVVGGVAYESRDLAALARLPAPSRGVLPVVELGLGDMLVAREDLADVERRLDERLLERGAARYAEAASKKAWMSDTLHTHTFLAAVIPAGRAREWTRATYEQLRGWTNAARDEAHALSYGPTLDRERLARGRFERGLGERAEEVAARLGSRAERLPPSAVALYVSARRGESDAAVGRAAARVLDEHVTEVVERVSAEAAAVVAIAHARRREHTLDARKVVERLRDFASERKDSPERDVGTAEPFITTR